MPNVPSATQTYDRELILSSLKSASRFAMVGLHNFLAMLPSALGATGRSSWKL